MILPERVLGSSGTTMIWRGLAIGPISLRHVVAQLLDDVLAAVRRRRLAQDHERARWPGRWSSSVGADHGGLGDLRVGDQRRLDLGGGEPVARDVHDVVDAAEQPDVAVLVLLGAVAGEVVALLANRDQ